MAFFRDVVGLDEVGRTGQSVFMRCWGDHYHHSLILSAGEQPALGHGAWRTHGPEELEAAVASIEASGITGKWVEESRSHGRAYRFNGPSGHALELFWEVERYVAPPELRSPYPDRPQRRGTRGIAPRQLDHLTVATRNVLSDAAWYRDTLGYRFMAYTSLDHNSDMVVFGVMTTNETSHDLGLAGDFSGASGRVNHVAFWMEESEDLLRAAELLVEAGTPVEFGPGRHGIGEQMYLYTAWDGIARERETFLRWMDANVLNAVRTPIGKHGGALSSVRPDDLAALALQALMERAGVPPAEVEDVYMGCANQAGEDNRDVARMALLLAGFPVEVAGTTINRLCGSGLDAVANAARALAPRAWAPRHHPATPVDHGGAAQSALHHLSPERGGAGKVRASQQPAGSQRDAVLPAPAGAYRRDDADHLPTVGAACQQYSRIFERPRGRSRSPAC